MTDPSRKSEIKKIYDRVAKGTALSGEEITQALKSIDEKYLQATEEIFKKYDQNQNKQEFDKSMIEATMTLYKETEEAVGKEISMKIYENSYAACKARSVARSVFTLGGLIKLGK